ncbi:MAG: insulinase family protein [Proteobacteria bacterium]|nr:insulinase family protein [Pseudomonadota bacterium]
MRQSVRQLLFASQAPVVLTALLAMNTSFAELDLNNASVSRLENGLTVVLLEDRNFPVASVQMLYRIGARDEVTGKTGLAHFLEHMAFRDSQNFPNTDVVSSIYARGGEWHGYTWTDQTTYFATIPNEHLDLLLRIEADRMSRLVIAESSMEAERGAVLAEMHMYENDPSSMLIDAVMFTSFLAHPYRNNTIGWESDIENLQHDDVVNFYRSHYHPSNGVLAVVGDIDSERTLARIRELFGDFEKRAPTALPVTIEPLQVGERRIQLSGNGETRQFKIAYRAPSANHADFAPFLVLQELLGGSSGVSFLQNDWGTPIRDDSLLTGAADDLTTWFPPSAQDYIFVIGGSAPHGVSEADVELEIEHRVAMIRGSAAHLSTLSAAISRVQDELIFDVETTEDAAHQLAYFEGLHALDTFLTLPYRIAAVTSDDVQRVAQQWLQPQRRTIAWHLPRRSPVETNTVSISPVGAKHSASTPHHAIDRQPLPSPVLRYLRGGIPVIVQQSDLSASIQVQVVVQGDNIIADHAIANSPARGYTSLVVRRRANELDAAVGSARESLDGATVDSSRAESDSDDPEARLEQTFERHMMATHAIEVAPALIVVSGNVDVDECFAILDRNFGDSTAKQAFARPAETIDNGQLIVRLGHPVAQAQLGYIVNAPGPRAARYDAIRILQYILSHGYEGRLGKEAISNRGLAYYVDNRYHSDGSNAWVTLGIGVDPQKIDALKTLMASEFRRLLDEPPTIEEFEEAKSYFLGRSKSAAQSNEELANELARQWVWHGDANTGQALERRLAALTHQDVLDVVSAFTNGLTIIVGE